MPCWRCLGQLAGADRRRRRLQITVGNDASDESDLLRNRFETICSRKTSRPAHFPIYDVARSAIESITVQSRRPAVSDILI